MEERFKQETNSLIRAWMRHDQKTLREYLVQDVEDPRINVQSILTRHFLIKALFDRRFNDLMPHELRFALVANWVLGLLKKSVASHQLHCLLDALLDGRRNAESIKIPRYILKIFQTLVVPNYICDFLSLSAAETIDGTIPEYLLATFQKIWCELLAEQKQKRISVLEAACGSANDYRFINAFGIARFIDYTGFDLCEKNILNAKYMFPKTRFEVGNVIEIDAPDNAYDYCFTNDLFEHLSIDAIEVAIAELCRVIRRKLCIGFFNMYDRKQHVLKPVGNYHYNALSTAVTKAVFKRYASRVQTIHIDRFLGSKFGCLGTHNKNAYTFIVTLRK